MSQDERRELARALAAIDLPYSVMDPRVRRRRQFGLMLEEALPALLRQRPGPVTAGDRSAS